MSQPERVYSTLETYSDSRLFGCFPQQTIQNNRIETFNTPYCAPSYDERLPMLSLKKQLYTPTDHTINKDVWSPDNCRLRQHLVNTEVQKGWTVFQRRTLPKTPVLWMMDDTI